MKLNHMTHWVTSGTSKVSDKIYCVPRRYLWKVAAMAHESARVRVKYGVLRGRIEPLEGGKSFFSFQGVPYAKPPVGSMRFKPAQSQEPWKGIRDALTEGPVCPQIEWIMKLPYRGDEDCLYLNVYTPQLPKENENLKIPVMVWIHGGGFEVGSGNSNVYGPHYLVNEGVVLVTINYRLGILGFLCVRDELQPDNLGLKDQVVALRWVHENIEAFGGDPKNVTIFGESAGGASVHYHMLSPMSKGLFHKAIMESGCALNKWATAKNPRQLAFTVGKEMGCNTSDAEELLKFLEGVPVRDLVETCYSITKSQEIGGKQWRFGPIPETYVTKTKDIFLPEHPEVLMEDGKFSPVPCIIGMNSQEGLFFLSVVGILENPSTLKYIKENLETYVSGDVNLKVSNLKAAQEIQKFYFGNEHFSGNTLDSFTDFMSDIWFTRGIYKSTQILASSTSPVYHYCFDFSGKMNIYKNFIGETNFTGACHMDEIGYLFTTPFFSTPKAELQSSEWITLSRMVQMWTNFAKNGNPTPLLNDIINIQWCSYSLENPMCLIIKNDLILRNNLYKERMDFWNSL